MSENLNSETMAILINDLHEFIRGTVKKNYGGFLSPKDIDRAVNRASYDLFNGLVKDYHKTEKFEFDHLFLKQHEFTIAVTDNGKNSLPDDYVIAVGIYFKDSDNNLHEGVLMKWDSFIDRKNSVIVPPTVKATAQNNEIRPIATIYDNLIEIAPKPFNDGSYTFILMYFREPVKAVFGYTEQNGVIAYDSALSTNLDWDSRSFTPIVTRALTYLGFPLRDGQTIQLEQVIDSNQARIGNN